MILRFFKGTGPGVLILIIITLVAVWIGAFLHPVMNSSYDYEIDPMPLYRLLKLIIGSNVFFGQVFSFLMVGLMSVLLVNFNTNEVFIGERTFLPAVFFILGIGLFPQNQLLNPVLPASLFLLIAIMKIIEGYHKQTTAYNFFDAGILISTGSLFYANLIWFGILIIIGIMLLRTVNFMEITISILGLLTPWLITFGLYYVAGSGLRSLIFLIKDNLFSNSIKLHLTSLYIVALIFTGIVVIVSIAYLLMLMNTKKIKSRKTFSLLLWAFIISLGVYFVMPSASVDIVYIICVPGSYILAHYFAINKKKLVPEIFFSLLLIFVMMIQIWHLK